MTTPATLRALAAEMCEAKKGSRDVDADIATQLVGKHRVVRTNPKPGGYQWKWIPPGSLRWMSLPHWSTSLDAKLSGEDIVLVAAPGYMISGNIGSDTRWMAQQRNAANCRSKAHTEPLARRAAGLLAMAQEKESA